MIKRQPNPVSASDALTKLSSFLQFLDEGEAYYDAQPTSDRLSAHINEPIQASASATTDVIGHHASQLHFGGYDSQRRPIYDQVTTVQASTGSWPTPPRQRSWNREETIQRHDQEEGSTPQLVATQRVLFIPAQEEDDRKGLVLEQNARDCDADDAPPPRASWTSTSPAETRWPSEPRSAEHPCTIKASSSQPLYSLTKASLQRGVEKEVPKRATSSSSSSGAQQQAHYSGSSVSMKIPARYYAKGNAVDSAASSAESTLRALKGAVARALGESDCIFFHADATR